MLYYQISLFDGFSGTVTLTGSRTRKGKFLRTVTLTGKLFFSFVFCVFRVVFRMFRAVLCIFLLFFALSVLFFAFFLFCSSFFPSFSLPIRLTRTRDGPRNALAVE